jgi:hypothetical protein
MEMNWSGREDLNLRPPGPEQSRVNAKLLVWNRLQNRRAPELHPSCTQRAMSALWRLFESWVCKKIVSNSFSYQAGSMAFSPSRMESSRQRRHQLDSTGERKFC